MGAPFLLMYLYSEYRPEEKKEEFRNFSSKDTTVKRTITNLRNKIQPSIEKFRNFISPTKKQQE